MSLPSHTLSLQRSRKGEREFLIRLDIDEDLGKRPAGRFFPQPTDQRDPVVPGKQDRVEEPLRKRALGRAAEGD